MDSHAITFEEDNGVNRENGGRTGLGRLVFILFFLLGLLFLLEGIVNGFGRAAVPGVVAIALVFGHGYEQRWLLLAV